MRGIELHAHDGKALPPTTTELEPDALYEWFETPGNLENTAHVRILAIPVGNIKNFGDPLKTLKIPIPPAVIEHAIWKPKVYYDLVDNPAGGATGLLDHPWRFILQTPLDGGPFCSLALSRHHTFVKGVFTYDSALFSPDVMSGGERSLSAWRSSGLQIVTLPQMILQAHSVHVSHLLANVVADVKEVESRLTDQDPTTLDSKSLSRTLHSCYARLIDLERRSRFESNVIEAIETMVVKSKHGTSPWPQLAPQRTAIASRSFDFESLPRRIENARATMSNLIQQRTEQVNLELRETSTRIAEATFKDAKSMKTIAILTMVFLPGTAIASFFSMNMFDWATSDGSHLASKWLWIYFIITVPLTGLVLGVWFIRDRRQTRGPRRQGNGGDEIPHAGFTDEEAGAAQSAGGESIELQETVPK